MMNYLHKKKKNNLVKLMKRLITENNEDITFIPKINRTISSDDINTISLEIPLLIIMFIKEEVFFKKLMIKNEEEYKINPILIPIPNLHINLLIFLF